MAFNVGVVAPSLRSPAGRQPLQVVRAPPQARRASLTLFHPQDALRRWKGTMLNTKRRPKKARPRGGGAATRALRAGERLPRATPLGQPPGGLAARAASADTRSWPRAAAPQKNRGVFAGLLAFVCLARLPSRLE